MRRLLLLSLLVLPSIVLGEGLAAAEGGPLRVVCTTTILADIARQVGGSRIEAISLIRAGTDPHTYQPTPDDVRLIASARLVVVNGLGYEGWLDHLIAAAGVTRERVVEAASGIEAMPAGGHPTGQARTGHDDG